MLHVRIKKTLTNYTLDVQFQIGANIVALYGPSGSGKTTTLHCIAGLTKIDTGIIELNNQLLVNDRLSLVPVEKRQIGYVFQQYALFPHKTVWENINYGMKNERYTKRLIEQLNMSHLLNRYPHEISGGEKQRTAFIRALATEPQLLLLDEPFSALDEKTKEISYEQLSIIHSSRKMPIILVTHNLNEVKMLANKVFHIEEGKFTKEVGNVSTYSKINPANLLTE